MHLPRRPGIAAAILAAALLAVPAVAPAQNAYDAFTPYVSARDMRGLARDSGGDLWIATNGGALRFEPDTQTFTQFPRTAVNRGPMGNDLVTVDLDAAGRVWFGDAAAGVAFVDPATLAWNEFVELPDLRIRRLRGLGGGVFIATANGLALRFTASRTDICNDFDPGCIVPSFVVNDYELTGDTLWVATSAGLGRFNGTTWDSLNTLPPGSGRATASLAVHASVLWRSTTGGGIEQLSDSGWVSTPGAARRLVLSEDRLYALDGSRVLRWSGSVFEDLQVPTGADIRDLEMAGTTMYLATSGGLQVWESGAGGVQAFYPPGPAQVGIYSALTVAADGRLVAGNRDDAHRLITFDGETWTEIAPGPDGFVDSATRALLTDRDGGIWVGHCCCPAPADCPTEFTDLETFEQLDTVPNVVLNVLGLAVDPAGRVWTATDRDGADVLTRDLSGVTRLPLTNSTTAGGLATDAAFNVAVTASAAYIGLRSAGVSVWNHGGAVNLSTIAQNWRTFTQDDDLLDGNVGGMTVSGNDVWVGTSSGIHRFRDGDLVEPCGTRPLGGEPNGDTGVVRRVNAVVVDRLGGLWMGTDLGLLHLPRGSGCNVSGGEYEIYVESNSPLPNNDVRSAVLHPDGSIWFGTRTGLLRVDPLALAGREPPPDQYVFYPNPIRLTPGSTPAQRRTFFGVEIGGNLPEPVPLEEASRPLVFDLTGRQVGQFDTFNGNAWVWDGSNENGDAVAPGLYLVRTRLAGGEVVVSKIGVVR